MKPKLKRIKEGIIFLTHQEHRMAMKVNLELLEKEYKAQHEKELEKLEDKMRTDWTADIHRLAERKDEELKEQLKLWKEDCDRAYKEIIEENQKLKVKVVWALDVNKKFAKYSKTLKKELEDLKKNRDELEDLLHKQDKEWRDVQKEIK